MLRLLGRRLVTSVVLLLLVAFAVFVLIDLAPQDPALRIAGFDAPPEILEQVRERLHLNDPLISRYGRWVTSALRGDLGTSLISNEPVTTALGRALPVTVSLILISMILSTVLGIALGVITALRPGGLVDRALSAAASFAIAVPAFWLGILLIIVFALWLGWLPALGYTPLSSGVWEWLKHLILPSASLAALGGAEVMRQLRSSLADTLSRQYILAARARGIPHTIVVLKHALKNAVGPVVTISGFRMAQLIGGTVFVEIVFSLRGLGALAVNTVLQGDLPVILGITIIALLAVVVMNLLVDIAYGYLNPRVRRP